jgi:two-component system chemotaxis response regulator CheB
MSSNKIKVMIIDDSVLIRKYVTTIINSFPDMEVVTTAPNGKIGLQKFFFYHPDIIILDIEMPEMNGLEFLKYIQANCAPSVRPKILVFSSLVGEGSTTTFEALANGAAEFIRKPDGKISDHITVISNQMGIIIRELYQTMIKNREHLPIPTTDAPEVIVPPPTPDGLLFGLDNLPKVWEAKPVRPLLIAIGSSTGGPNAIRKIMSTLKPIPVPMVIAQHMPTGFTLEFAKNLTKIYNRPVIEAKDGDVLENGTIYVCPGGCHSLIKSAGDKLVFKTDLMEYDGFFFKPSVDIFFKSIREAVGNRVLGLILSGMGRDGSIESVRLRKDGAIMIAQDEKSSVVWGMPGNSIKNGGIDIVIEISDIGEAINRVIAATCK